MQYLARVIDVETGGFSPAANPLLEVGFGIITSDLELLFHDSIYILPQEGTTVNPGAAEVNGYTPELWEERGAVPLSEAVSMLTARWSAEYDKPLQMAGVNTSFDLRFMQHYCQPLVAKFIDTSVPLLDATTYGRRWWNNQGVTKPPKGALTLTGMLRDMGQTRGADAHGGFEDVADTVKLLRLQRQAGLW